MKQTKKYWKGLEELNSESEFVERAQSEFPEYLSVKENSDQDDSSETSRRDFLKLMGFSVAAASLAACDAPVKKVIPYINKPENVDPGKANWYATSYVNGGSYCGLLVKTREGRPVKIEGNPDSITRGGVGSQALASILNLYDSSRLKNFQQKVEKDGKSDFQDVSKADADKQIIAKLKEFAKAGNKKVRIVTETILSPSTKSVIADFIKKYPSIDIQTVVYDPISASGILKANGGTIPSYNFEKAETIVGFSADFLGTFLSPIEFTKQYAQNRKVSTTKKTMSKHFQFESVFTLTGANADKRFAIKPSEEPYYIIALYNAIASKAGRSSVSAKTVKNTEAVSKVADALWSSKGKALVVAGSNDEAVQFFVAQINEMISATIDTNPSLIKQGSDDSLLQFVEDLSAKKIDGVIFNNANPVYNTPFSKEITKGLKNVELTISFADRAEETASECDFICPGYHYLESWGDVEPKQGTVGIVQPTISPIFDLESKGFENRAIQDSFLAWSESDVSYYTYLQNFWKENYFSKQTKEVTFDKFWFNAVRNGEFTYSGAAPEISTVTSDSTGTPVITEANSTMSFQYNKGISSSEAISKIKKFYKESSELELIVFENSTMGSGTFANNPWILETPDPISKVTWDNYVAVSISDAKAKNLKQGDLVDVVLKGKGTVVLPVLVQPGQAKGTVSVALGFGRTKAGKVAEQLRLYKNPAGAKVKAVGVDVYPFVNVKHSTLSYSASGVLIIPTGKTFPLAQTQTHHTIMGRDTEGGETIIQEAKLADFNNASLPKDQRTGVITKLIGTSEGAVTPEKVDLWAAPVRDEEGKLAETIIHEYKDHHWGMVIDLNSCTGCSACIVSCNSENNVPVVGKDEVLRRREMHWLRIDRYYSSETTDQGFGAMEDPAENPKVVFQPMMCQHCDHAPCETVCPVAATTHSSEGLNQMTYNRCIGTRYCANNCPYKVRRFNWFNYSDTLDEDREAGVVNVSMNDDLGKMVLNPDVVVRARGTMEKCSMCVQRIQAGKLKSKMEGRRTSDDDINTACASVCPADAITFGDMNNPESKISKVLAEENADRAYDVLSELNVKPNVSYLSKIRNN